MCDTTCINIGSYETLKEFELRDNGKIEVIYVIEPQVSTWPPQRKRAEKRIYKAEDGKIVLEKTETGQVVPEQHIPESIEWK